MSNVKRTPGIHFTIEKRRSFNLSGLLSGKIELLEREQLVAYVSSLNKELIIDLTDAQILIAADSTEWLKSAELAKRCGVQIERIEKLVEVGLLLSPADDSTRLDSESLRLWDPTALYYHNRTKWDTSSEHQGLADAVESAEEWARDSAANFTRQKQEFGEIPPHFHQRVTHDERIELPLNNYHSSLTETLKARCTVRLYDTEKLLDFDTLAKVLFHVFGCQGYAKLSQDMIAVKKTSPSGGSLHPVEVYPLIIGVNDLSPGLYHYHVGDHALEPLRQFSEKEARELAKSITSGQSYFASAHVLLLYTARFERSFWKYREHDKAYKAIQLDLGHLSQSLYLMSTDLGLGAFITAACNDQLIEQELGLDGIREGALAVGGFGIPLPDEAALRLPAIDYVPRTTEI